MSAPPPKKLGRGLTDYLIRTGEPLLATPEVLQAMEDRGEVARNGSRSLDWMGVPLRVNNHTFGALVVQTYSKNIRYGERDKEILTFVARQLASAVEIKRNEQALRRSEARYRSLVQSSVYGIYRSSLEGRFLDVNPALITMLGYESAEEVLLLDPEERCVCATAGACAPHRGVPPQRSSGRNRSEVEAQRWKPPSPCESADAP